jgi:hypothetical protein
MIVLYNCALPDDGPTRLETCSISDTLKHNSNCKKVYDFVGLGCNKFGFYISWAWYRFMEHNFYKKISYRFL